MISIEEKKTKIIRKTPEPKYERLPVIIPISYGFPSAKKKKAPDFRQSHSIDVSSNGIAIQIIDMDEETKANLNVPNRKILMKVDIPKKEGPVELGGSIKWVKTEKIKKNFQIIMGIEFDEADYDRRLVLLSYALSVHRKTKIIRISTIILSVLLFFAVVWGFRTFVLKKEVEQKLEISEVSRNNLKNEIGELLIKKNEIESRLDENKNKLETQIKELSRLKEDLDKTTKTLEISKELIAGFEEKFFEYVVISDNENIFVNISSDLAAFSNENYIKGTKALENKKYNEAITFLKKFTKEMPECSLGYSGLARALYRAGKESEAKDVFKKYEEIVNKRQR